MLIYICMMHMCIYIYMYIYIYIYIDAYLRVFPKTHKLPGEFEVCIYRYIYTYIWSMYIYIYIHIYMNIYIYLYINIYTLPEGVSKDPQTPRRIWSMYIWIYIKIYMKYVYIHKYTYVYEYIHIFIYKYIYVTWGCFQRPANSQENLKLKKREYSHTFRTATQPNKETWDVATQMWVHMCIYIYVHIYMYIYVHAMCVYIYTYIYTYIHIYIYIRIMRCCNLKNNSQDAKRVQGGEREGLGAESIYYTLRAFYKTTITKGPTMLESLAPFEKL